MFVGVIFIYENVNRVKIETNINIKKNLVASGTVLLTNIVMKRNSI